MSASQGRDRRPVRTLLLGFGAPVLGLALAVPLTLAVTGGRDAGHATEPREPAIGPVHVLRSDADIRLPLDDYLLSTRQAYTISRAVNSIGRACLRTFGLSWPATPPWIEDPQPRNARRYAITDARLAGSDGYHPASTLRRHRAISAQTAALPRPSADAVAVWSGTGETNYHGRPVPDGGCMGAATRRLAGNATVADPDLAQRLQLSTFEQTKADGRVRRVFARWRDCMAGRGYRYADPFAAIGDPRWLSDRVSPAEIAVARADVDCKQLANVAGTMYAVETAYQRRAAEQHAPQLAALRAYLTTQLANAN